ncbi:MAG: hypothetical protein EOS76_06765 [Mesorhizobium sp.]|uniref:hypothetical protein n=1 Tax=unclassified Mesorhizobium TaxID=325217 RepID=UPI000F7624CA|nr:MULTISPECIES: hypothetical protein [unclassified Mesorhizobium]RVC75907.1 hypothetical protein EN766_15005 [Mesorhizobium sp. M2A.F.Ca.ET.046.02.1.1]AZO34039.1 hypothetical protein EJ072_05615 [Mesorhizobium sp. M2A.F.Ca.ET.046.03.2.1]AZO71462.1 hypothetical protein EJ067_09965 [Mesorhizobium sp. M1D.F.Ca.ET.043.01.1.1]RWB47005.1 MAG: hypothetical protein EOQ44_07435 [Mesorhizobium sp.]RWE20791.1 MAG: hypothetical protein EOS76_06765 [Mesorhizobium sp.]
MAVPLYIAAIGLAMLASAIWSFRRGSFLGCAAWLLMAALCAYALMLSPAHSGPAKTPIARCTSFLRVFVLPLHGGLKYSLIKATQQGDPPTVTIELRPATNCVLQVDRSAPASSTEIGAISSLYTLDGQRSQIIYD